MKNCYLRRLLSLLLCICLLLPFVQVPLFSAAGSGTPAYKKLVDIAYTATSQQAVGSGSNKEIFAAGKAFESAIDLTAFGYPTTGKIAAGQLGLQMDVSLYGTDAVVDALVAGEATGAIELTSGGIHDTEEMRVTAGLYMGFVKNAWTRTVIDLNLFSEFATDPFDPQNFNYMRIYINGLAEEFTGQSCIIKICNVQIVDLTQPLSAADTPELGDGTTPDDFPGGTVMQGVAFEPIYELNMRETGAKTINSRGQIFTTAEVLEEAVDFTDYGFAGGTIDQGKLGVQMDLYLYCEDALYAAIQGGETTGQIEFSSAGECDKEEIRVTAEKLPFKNKEWVRVVLDLSLFGQTPEDPIDATAVNYFRIYYNGFTEFEGKTCQIKVMNVKLVDLTKRIPAAEAPRVGDGSFTAAEPVWTHYPVDDAFDSSEVLVAGYNLKEYLQAHPELGSVTDYTPIIQSLLDGLERAKGGVLYIPAGIYPCYHELVIPRGVTIQGDWKNPDKDPKITGTVLAVYCGARQEKGTPFITMSQNSCVRNLAFWYPEQTNYEAPLSYPTTVYFGASSTVENITFVNAYKGLAYGTVGKGSISCPESRNIYGTPLYYGADIDMVADSFGWENFHFAPDYWINSGLPGSPVSADDQDSLRNYLYYNAYGIVLRRMDWSWVSYSSVKGYSVGVMFDKSIVHEGRAANGQCFELYFEDCATALGVEQVGSAGEVVTNMTVKNCEVGVWYSDSADTTNGNVKLINADIEATDTAAWLSETAYLSLVSSVIRSGTVGAEGGYFSVMDTTFLNEGPQIILDSGTLLANITDCVDGVGRAVEVENIALCAVNEDTAVLQLNTLPEIEASVALDQAQKPDTKDGKEHVTIATLDNTGTTDVSAALQGLLDAQAVTGGTVYLPNGYYRLNNAITIPTGVELKGALDFGRAEVYNGLGTILQVYHGRGTEEGATVTLKENSGIRGVLFNYPEQFYLDHTFTPYPHTIQGQGKDVYIVNVTVRNGWSGVDLMTYRCDNHYVDDFRGACVRSFVAVGGGSENGVLRNCHVQYTSWNFGAADFHGNWPSLGLTENIQDEYELFRQILYKEIMHNGTVYTVGHVKNQLHYGSMNYGGGIGMKFVAEKTGAADVTVYGFNTDYNTVAIDVQDGERVDFINLQLTAFNRIGDDLTAEMTSIQLGADFDGTVNVWGATLYENPDQMLKVKNGTLNIYAARLANTTTMVNVAQKGRVQLYECIFTESLGGFHNAQPRDTLVLAPANRQNIVINGGYYTKPFDNLDGIAQFNNMHEVIYFWDAPSNVQLPQEATLIFSEAFTDYGSRSEAEQTFEIFIDGSAQVMESGDMLHIQLPGDTYTAGAATSALELIGGNAEALYRLETRLNIRSMRDTEYSAFALMAVDADDNMTNLLTFHPNGTVTVSDTDGNESVLGSYTAGEWYRVGFEIDLRDQKNKTFRVYLMDDEYTILASSNALRFGDDMQGTDTLLNQLQFVAETDINDDTAVTMVSVDYLIVAQSATSTFGLLGDVDGDGRVSSTDARLTLQYYVGKIPSDTINRGLADVDKDGKVTSTDARLILQYYVGKIKNWP